MKLEKRTEKLRDVRKASYVPGVIFGKSIQSTPIKTSDKDLKDALKAYGKNMTFKVDFEGEEHFVYIKNIQSNILKPSEIIHFDLHCVTAEDKISAKIPVHMTGHEVFFGKSLYAELVLHEVHATYSPGQGLQSIDIDVSKLSLGDEILIEDLKVPEGVELKDDPKSPVVIVKEVHVAAEETEEETSEIEGEETEETSETEDAA